MTITRTCNPVCRGPHLPVRMLAVTNQPLRRRVPMKRHLLVALAAVLAVGISASMASAQCAFEHPKSAKKVQGSLVQAFVSCGNPGGNSQNTTVGGAVPACRPPETFCEQSSNCPGTGWEWDELGSTGTVTFKSLKFCYGKSTGTPLAACSPSDPLNSA